MRAKKLFAYGMLMVIYTLAGVANAGGGGAAGQLPRVLGTFKLGMDSTEFTNLTRVTPQPCPRCIENEAFASLTAEEAHKFISNLDSNFGMDFHFFENKLYHISLGTEPSEFTEVRKKLTEQYGLGRSYDLQNGTSFMQWDNENTVVTANYQTATQQVFALNYFDWDVKQKRDSRATMNQGQAAR